MKRNIFIVLFLGIVLRLVLACFTFHPDFIIPHLAGRLILGGNFLNLYDYIANLSLNDPLSKLLPPYPFHYPPLTFAFFGYVSGVLCSVIPDSFHREVIYNLPYVMGSSQFKILLLLFKLAYLPFDIAIAFLLMRFFENGRDKFLAFVLWIFNPPAIYATYMMGQFDILPTFFVVLSLSLLFSRKANMTKNLYLASFFLGLGACFKIYPLLFVVPTFLLTKSWKERIISSTIVFGTYFLPLIPFLNSPGFRNSALVAGQTLKSFYAQIPISGGESIILYPTFLIFAYLFFYFKPISAKDLWKRFFVILLIFFIFTHYHPQWFLWITPFLIIDLVYSRFLHWPLVAISLFSFVALLFFFEPSLTIGLFSPLYPNLINSPSIWKILGLNLDINFSRSVFQTLFVGGALYYLFLFSFRDLGTGN